MFKIYGESEEYRKTMEYWIERQKMNKGKELSTVGILIALAIFLILLVTMLIKYSVMMFIVICLFIIIGLMDRVANDKGELKS